MALTGWYSPKEDEENLLIDTTVGYTGALTDYLITYSIDSEVVQAQKDSPDVIIVGVPEGIMSSSRYQLNHFGEYPLIVSKAVRPDIGFICTYFVNGTGLEDVITQTAGYCQRRLGIPVGAVCVSKTVFSLPQEESEPLIIDNLGDDYVKKYYPHFTNPAIPVIDMTDKSAAVSAILSGIGPLQTNIVSI